MLCHHGGFRTYEEEVPWGGGGGVVGGEGWENGQSRVALVLPSPPLQLLRDGALEAEEGAVGGLASLKWGEKGSGGVSAGPTRWRCRPSLGAGGTQSCCQVTPGASPAPGLWVSQSGGLVKVQIPGLSRSGLGRRKLHL